MAAPFDERLFAHPARFAFIVVVCLLILVTLLVAGILGLRPIPSLPPQNLISDTLAGLLALGTSGLAYSAGLQATSTEKARVGNLRPNLAIQIQRDLSVSGAAGLPISVKHSPFFTSLPGPGTLRFSIRNMGPGNAMKVWVWATTWPVAVEQVSNWTTQMNFTAPTEEPIAYHLCVMNETLKTNEEYPFELVAAMPRSPANAGERKLSYLMRQVLLQARCEDVEGRPQPIVLRGVRLQLLVPKPAITVVDKLGNREPSGTGFEMLWEVLTEAEANRAPRGKDPETKFARTS